MAKEKTIYVCRTCGTKYAKWQGNCNACGEWNTIEEEKVSPTPAGKNAPRSFMPEDKANKPLRIGEVESGDEERIDLCDEEFNRVLGGGLVRGAFTLLGGEPGIGKSTLILQTVLRLPTLRTLYVSGEESARQLKMRAERLGLAENECYVLCETNLDRILTRTNEIKPDLLVIDSIQTVYTEEVESSAGSVGQIRECAALLLKYCKITGVPVIVIGHITKEGSIAGPKVLEHIVDTVLQFDGDKHHLYRILRSQKNRYGSTAELGIYEMRREGLRGVENPSEHLITLNREDLSGMAIAVAMEGIRPILIEAQALVSSAIYANPQRSSTGFDLRRMNMLLAVLEKRAGFKLVQKDVFLNIAGGIKITDPATDLAVISSVLSSSLDIVIPPAVCMTGEVGLSGEIRPVNRIEQRITEAQRIGFREILIPTDNYREEYNDRFGIRLVPVRKVEEAFRHLFAKGRE
ncbi:DNA repair protein RadA [Porphyromonas loveana]|uniref:DNA repair protein RadA n=1 Tax=Porphyromonas loveana TaxID=1884669 RepID=UPI0035A0C7C0